MTVSIWKGLVIRLYVGRQRGLNTYFSLWSAVLRGVRSPVVFVETGEDVSVSGLRRPPQEEGGEAQVQLREPRVPHDLCGLFSGERVLKQNQADDQGCRGPASWRSPSWRWVKVARECSYCGEPREVGPVYLYCRTCKKYFLRQRKLRGFTDDVE